MKIDSPLVYAGPKCNPPIDSLHTIISSSHIALCYASSGKMLPTNWFVKQHHFGLKKVSTTSTERRFAVSKMCALHDTARSFPGPDPPSPRLEIMDGRRAYVPARCSDV